jgi:type VI protein secretion system component VasF
MDCPSSVRLANALSFLAATNQQHVLRYLALLEARNNASSTLLVVAGALKSLTRYLPDTRQAALIADITQTTSQDISDFVCAAQKACASPKLDPPVFSTTSLVILPTTIFQIKIRS